MTSTALQLAGSTRVVQVDRTSSHDLLARIEQASATFANDAQIDPSSVRVCIDASRNPVDIHLATCQGLCLGAAVRRFYSLDPSFVWIERVCSPPHSSEAVSRWYVVVVDRFCVQAAAVLGDDEDGQLEFDSVFADIKADIVRGLSEDVQAFKQAFTGWKVFDSAAQGFIEGRATRAQGFAEGCDFLLLEQALKAANFTKTLSFSKYAKPALALTALAASFVLVKLIPFSAHQTTPGVVDTTQTSILDVSLRPQQDYIDAAATLEILGRQAADLYLTSGGLLHVATATLNDNHLDLHLAATDTGQKVDQELRRGLLQHWAHKTGSRVVRDDKVWLHSKTLDRRARPASGTFEHSGKDAVRELVRRLGLAYTIDDSGWRLNLNDLPIGVLFVLHQALLNYPVALHQLEIAFGQDLSLEGFILLKAVQKL